MKSDVRPNWGPTGETVYTRTYSRPKPDGSRETWAETVGRVVRGNLSLVYGPEDEWTHDVWIEADDLYDLIYSFRAIPAGRHLWATGAPGRQFLFNCHVAGWDSVATHADFMLMRGAEGGGLGANYSTKHLKPLGAPEKPVTVHIVCDPEHADYQAMEDAGVITRDYSPEWEGAFPVEDTREGWAAAVRELIDSAYRPDLKHRDRVFDLSRVRPEGSRLKTMGGTASGPLPLAQMLTEIGRVLTRAHERVREENVRSVPNPRGGWARDYSRVKPSEHHLTPLEAMDIDHAIAVAIVAGGTRRFARMSLIHWNDPYVFDFIRAKTEFGQHWSTNISVEVDDDFFRALEDADGTHAHDVLTAVVKGMLTNGEPGFWNSSLSNVGEPNEVIATNPCGEIALEPWENCNLGHVNMDAFVTPSGAVDFEGAEKAHRLMTRFLIRATYGDVVDDKQAATLARNRRIGVGHFGLQGFVCKQGYRLSEVARDYANGVGPHKVETALRHLADVVDAAAVEYAHDLRIPVPVKKRTEAPTGSIAKMPGRSEGAHPIYARYFIRRVMFSKIDPEQRRQVEEFKAQGYHVEPSRYAANTDVVSFVTQDQLVSEVEAMGIDPEVVESADEISLENMLAWQAMIQDAWADNAVSFTANVIAEPHQQQMLDLGYNDMPEPTERRVDEAAGVIAHWLPRLKGTTLMVDGTRPQSPYTRLTREQYEAEKAAGVKVTTDASYDEDCASGACPIK